MTRRLRDVPGVPTNLSLELRNLLLSLRENVRALAGYDGQGGGFETQSSGGGGTTVVINNPPADPVDPGEYVPDLSPPPTPSSVVVSGGIDFVFLQTDPPAFTQGHGYARTIVYGAKYSGSGPLPTFGNAVKVHEFVGDVGSFPTDPATTWHLWLKWLTVDNVLSVSPSGGTNGHVAVTGQDVSRLLAALNNKITQSQLFSTLGQRIDLIDAPATTVGSVNQRLETAEGNLSAQITTVSARVDDGANFYTFLGWEFENSAQGWTTTNGTTTLLASSLRVVASNNDPRIQYTLATAERFVGARYDLVRMRARRVGLPANYDLSFLWATAGHTFTNSFRTAPEAIPADTTQWFVYEWDLANPDTGGTDWMDNTITALRVDLGSLTGATWEVDWIAIGKRGVSAPAATVQQEISTRASETGYLGAQWSVRMTAGNIAGGFGLSGTSAAGSSPMIDFGVRANRFFIAPPEGSPGTIPNLIPFAVQTTAYVDPTTGETLAPGVYMSAAYIRDLEVALGRFQNAFITNAMIQNLSVSKLAGGSMSVGAFIRSATYTAGSLGFNINANGTAEFNQVTARGTIVASAGSIGGAVITSTEVRSSNFAAGSAGWRLTGAGNLEANSGTFRGNLSAATGTFAGVITAEDVITTKNIAPQAIIIPAGVRGNASSVVVAPGTAPAVFLSGLQATVTLPVDSVGGGIHVAASVNLTFASTINSVQTQFASGTAIVQLVRENLSTSGGSVVLDEMDGISVSYSVSNFDGSVSGTHTNRYRFTTTVYESLPPGSYRYRINFLLDNTGTASLRLSWTRPSISAIGAVK